MLRSVGVRTVIVFGYIAVFSIRAVANTSVYTIPGQASAVVTTSPDSLSFQMTNLFRNPMDLMDDLSGFFSAFSASPQSPQLLPVRRPLLQIRMEGLLRTDAGPRLGAYCRFFRTATWAVAEMGGSPWNRIASVRLQFGTADGGDQVAGVFPDPREPSIPGMFGVATVMAIAGLMIRRKRQRLLTPTIVRADGTRRYAGWSVSELLLRTLQ